MEALKLDGLALKHGEPMTKNLLKGFEVVVFNRNRDKERN
jgi:3-hydroxyisobutyrate dehydrogenase-like beta-hydroxyacid dehydrogenase